MVAGTEFEVQGEQDSFLASESHQTVSKARHWKRAAGLAVAGLAVVAFASPLWRRTRQGTRVSAQGTVVGLDEVNHGCSAKGEDCQHTRCCHQDGMQCFGKNEFWAVCNTTCEPGVHPGEDNKGWTCAVLQPLGVETPPADEGTPATDCAEGNGEDCSHSKCCKDPDLRCFQKNEYYATCKQDCAAQVLAGDEDEKPWSCLILTPDMKDTTTTPELKTPPQHPGQPGPPVICDGGPIPQLPSFSGYEGPKPMMIKVLTYNLFWWNLMGVRKGNGNSAGLLLRSTNSPLPWDLMGFQECEDGAMFIASTGLQGQMEMTQFHPLTKTAAICFAYRRAAFDLISQGGEFVSEDSEDQYFGKRAVQWQRLMHKASGKPVFFMNLHGPLPVNTGGKCGGHVTGIHILRAIANNAQAGDAIILTGDFNAEPGSATLKVISQRLTDFVPAAIDNIFSNLPVGSLVRNMDIGNGGSDHDARLAVFQLGHMTPHADMEV